jgi:hypothetical protein
MISRGSDDTLVCAVEVERAFSLLIDTFEAGDPLLQRPDPAQERGDGDCENRRDRVVGVAEDIPEHPPMMTAESAG